MKLPRDVNGLDLANHLVRHWGYRKAAQNGSHIMLKTDQPTESTVTIPAHRPMKTGMLAGILKQVADHKQVSRDDILRRL